MYEFALSYCDVDLEAVVMHGSLVQTLVDSDDNMIKHVHGMLGRDAENKFAIQPGGFPKPETRTWTVLSSK